MYRKCQHLAFLLCALAGSWAVAGPAACAASADDQYAVAAGHYSQAHWELAAAEFLTFLRDHGEDARRDDATFFLGEALVQLGKYAEAQEHFIAVLKHAPNHRYAKQGLFRSGETAFLSGQRDLARKYLGKFRADYPQDDMNAFVLPYLGELALGEGDGQVAAQAFSTLLEEFPGSALAGESGLGLARAYELTGRADDAARQYRRLAGDTAGPLADDAQFYLGLLEYNRRQYAAAEGVLATFEQTFAGSDLQTGARYWRAMALLARDQLTPALETIERAKRDAPQHTLAPALTYYQAETLRRLERYEEAERLYRELIETDAEQGWGDEALRGLVTSAFKRGDAATVRSGSDLFDEKWPHSPLRPEVRLVLGRSLLAEKQFAVAATVLRESLDRLDQAERQPATAPAAVRGPAVVTPPVANPQTVRNSTRYLIGLAELGAERYEAAREYLGEVDLQQAGGELAAGVQFARATSLIGQQKYAEAVEPLQAYLKLDPTGADAAKARAQLTIALARTGRLEEAREALASLEKHHPRHETLLPTTLYLAEAAFGAGERSWARDLFGKLAARENPPEYVAKGLSGLAWSQLETNDPAKSAETFHRLLREHADSPLAPRAALARALALERLDQTDAAVATYRLIVSRYPDSEEVPVAMLNASTLLDRLEQDAEAAELLADLVTKHPEFKQIDAALYQWAWVLTDLDELDEADALFLRLHEEHPASRFWLDASYRLAERAATNGRYQQAQALAGKIIAAQPTGEVLAHTLYLQGQLASRTGQWERVAAPMQRLIKEFPESTLRLPAEYWTAEATYRRGEYVEAGKQFEELSRKIQGRNDAWLGMIPLRQAQVLAQEKQWAEARQLALTIAQRYPDFAQQYEVDYLLGRSLANQADFTAARTAYQRVIDSPAGGKTETAAMAQWMIGESFFHQRRYDEAIQAYSRVEILYDYPQWQAGALLQAGKCYELQGDWLKAADRYNQLLKKHPQTMFSDEATRRLRVAQERATETVR